MLSRWRDSFPVAGVIAVMVNDLESQLHLFLVDYCSIDEPFFLRAFLYHVVMMMMMMMMMKMMMMMLTLHRPRLVKYIDHQPFFLYKWTTACTTIQVDEHNRRVLPTIPKQFHSVIAFLPPKIDPISKIPTALLLRGHICLYCLATSKDVQRLPHL